jgi:hypothetical protein
MTENKRAVESYLSNPLLLLVVGAVISGLLIPYITSQWQNHEKELELKTNLVTRISESLSGVLTTAQFSAANRTEQAEYLQAYYEWEATHSAIGSYIRAYFPNTYIGEEWDKFANATTSFFRLAAINPLQEKQQLVDQLEKYFSSCESTIEWDALINRDNLFFYNEDYRSNWFKVKNQIISSKNNIVQNVMEAPIFSWNPFLQTDTNRESDNGINRIGC